MAEGGAPRDWDGATYDRVSDPMTRWGTHVLDRLPLRGDETVLDAGCGSGRVTALLAERLPRGRVIALDGSPSMIEAARARLAHLGDRASFVVADLGAPLPVDGASVDAVLSTATFHWVRDHDALFRNLAMVMRPGARLAAQCGGAGNIASVRAAITAAGEPWEGPWTFATPGETRARLGSAGFVDIEAWLHDEPTSVVPGEPTCLEPGEHLRGEHLRGEHLPSVAGERGEHLREYLRTVVLGAHLDRLAPDRREAFVEAVAARLASPVIDYVRLNILATRG